MKSELDRVLEEVPQVSTIREAIGVGPNATVYINDIGSLCIIGEFGVLQLSEKNLGHLVADGSI
jgi:hypothetical protein